MRRFLITNQALQYVAIIMESRCVEGRAGGVGLEFQVLAQGGEELPQQRAYLWAQVQPIPLMKVLFAQTPCEAEGR